MGNTTVYRRRVGGACRAARLAASRHCAMTGARRARDWAAPSTVAELQSARHNKCMVISPGLREFGRCVAIMTLVGVGVRATAASLYVDFRTEHYLVDGALAGWLGVPCRGMVAPASAEPCRRVIDRRPGRRPRACDGPRRRKAPNPGTGGAGNEGASGSSRASRSGVRRARATLRPLRSRRLLYLVEKPMEISLCNGVSKLFCSPPHS